MVTIGITGPTGCGKTTLLQEIAARGGEIVDCDALYYELLKTDPDLKSALEHAFGDIFLPDGSLDRPKLASMVFSSADKAGRERQLAPQKRQKRSLALCSMRKHHRARLLSEILPYHTAKKPKLQANSRVPAFRRGKTRSAPSAFFP